MGPSPAEYFRDFQSNYSPAPPPPAPTLFGLGGQQSGPVGGLVQSFGPMVAEVVRQQLGGFGFQFGADMNVANSFYARQYLQQLNAARAFGAAADAPQVESMVRGLAVAFGHEQRGRFDDGRVRFADATERSIETMSRDIAGDPSGRGMSMLSVLAAMFPDTVDRAMPRGSMAVAASSFVNAGRFVFDPQTGRSLASDREAAAKVLGPLVAQGPEATAGLGAGRLGQIFEELSARGLAGGGAQTGAEQKAQITEQLQKYSAAVSTVRDIFGENGRPDAPMPELIRGLQALTQGGFGRTDPAELARIATTFQAMSQTTGLSFAQLQQMTTGFGAVLREQGGTRVSGQLAAPVAVRAATMRSAFTDLGLGVGGGPETPTDREFAVMAGRDLANFATSDAGNLVGAVLYNAQYANEFSPLAQAAQALAAGKPSVDIDGHGTFDLRNLTQQSVLRLFERSGIRGTTALNALGNVRQNQAALVRNPGALAAGEAAQKSQAEFVMAGLLQRTAVTDVGGVVNQVFALAPQARSDAELANLVGNAMNLNPDQRAAVGNMLGQLGAMRGDEGGFVAAQRYGPEAAERAQAARAQVEERAEVLKRLQSVQRGGFLRNMSGALSEMSRTQNPELQQLILRAFGFVGNDDAAKALGVNPADVKGDDALNQLLDPGRPPQNFIGPPAPGQRLPGGPDVGNRPVTINIKADKIEIARSGAGGATITSGGALTGG